MMTMLSRFHLIPERHGRTDEQTDRIPISISRQKLARYDRLLFYIFPDFKTTLTLYNKT